MVFLQIFLLSWACCCDVQVVVPEGSGSSKVRVNVKHDLHGMLTVQTAEMMKEVIKVTLLVPFVLLSPN